MVQASLGEIADDWQLGVRFLRHGRADEWVFQERPGGRSHQGQEGSFTRPDPAIPCRVARPTMLRTVPGPTLSCRATSILAETEEG